MAILRYAFEKKNRVYGFRGDGVASCTYIIMLEDKSFANRSCNLTGSSTVRLRKITWPSEGK